MIQKSAIVRRKRIRALEVTFGTHSKPCARIYRWVLSQLQRIPGWPVKSKITDDIDCAHKDRLCEFYFAQFLMNLRLNVSIQNRSRNFGSGKKYWLMVSVTRLLEFAARYAHRRPHFITSANIAANSRNPLGRFGDQAKDAVKSCRDPYALCPAGLMTKLITRATTWKMRRQKSTVILTMNIICMYVWM